MEQQPTCGQRLAYHAALPAALANLMGAVAGTLEIHFTALNPNDKGSRPEFDAYVALSAEHRELESRLRALALQMEGYRDLPMAAHDWSVMTSPAAVQAFARFVEHEEHLAGRLRELVERHRAMMPR
ncbi:MAG TPA: hypothetical protein VM115_01380 [Vicinamibacterales bacterium]|nr:hypothetical protein [Vicinamibacterales bacterium]